MRGKIIFSSVEQDSPAFSIFVAQKFNLMKETIAILCGGGPAPGINSVISSVADRKSVV